MNVLTEFWLPILLSAAGVFIASSILHMVLKFWHMPDYSAFSNEDAVREAVRGGATKPGVYTLPYCRMEDMNKPEVREKFEEGPVGMLVLQKSGMPSMGKHLAQWFGFCLLVPILTAFIAAGSVEADAGFSDTFGQVALVAFMGFAVGAIPYGIWWGHPWKVVVKELVDGAIYAAITGTIFAWLWPQGM